MCVVEERGEVGVWDLCVGARVGGSEGDWACVSVDSNR